MIYKNKIYFDNLKKQILFLFKKKKTIKKIRQILKLSHSQNQIPSFKVIKFLFESIQFY